MACTDRPLNSEERAEITRNIGIAMKKIGAERAVSPSQAKLQELIGQAIDTYRNVDKPLTDKTLETMSKCLGCLWGQVFCDEFGWTWALIKTDGTVQYGVVTPNRSHVIYPIPFIQDLLAGTSPETGTLPMYRRILAGQIPASKDHGYLVL